MCGEDCIPEGAHRRLVRRDDVEGRCMLVRRAPQRTASLAKRQNSDRRALPAGGEDGELAAPERVPPRLDSAGADERRRVGSRSKLVPLRGDGRQALGRDEDRAGVSFCGQRLTKARKAPPSGRHARGGSGSPPRRGSSSLLASPQMLTSAERPPEALKRVWATRLSEHMTETPGRAQHGRLGRSVSTRQLFRACGEANAACTSAPRRASVPACGRRIVRPGTWLQLPRVP
jgi:hypothetical protein